MHLQGNRGGYLRAILFWKREKKCVVSGRKQRTYDLQGRLPTAKNATATFGTHHRHERHVNVANRMAEARISWRLGYRLDSANEDGGGKRQGRPKLGSQSLAYAFGLACWMVTVLQDLRSDWLISLANTISDGFGGIPIKGFS